jgi:hypothetical protein
MKVLASFMASEYSAFFLPRCEVLVIFSDNFHASSSIAFILFIES